MFMKKWLTNIDFAYLNEEQLLEFLQKPDEPNLKTHPNQMIISHLIDEYTLVRNLFVGNLNKHRKAQEQSIESEYVEVSDRIRKVTYNTDHFDKLNFERRKGDSFNFNSGKVGKFIECEFDIELPISQTKIVSVERADITFVI